MALAREMFRKELLEKNIDPRAMLFAANDIKDMMEPPSFNHSVRIGAHTTHNHPGIILSICHIQQKKTLCNHLICLGHLHDYFGVNS